MRYLILALALTTACKTRHPVSDVADTHSTQSSAASEVSVTPGITLNATSTPSSSPQVSLKSTDLLSYFPNTKTLTVTLGSEPDANDPSYKFIAAQWSMPPILKIYAIATLCQNCQGSDSLRQIVVTDSEIAFPWYPSNWGGSSGQMQVQLCYDDGVSPANCPIRGSTSVTFNDFPLAPDALAKWQAIQKTQAEIQYSLGFTPIMTQYQALAQNIADTQLIFPHNGVTNFLALGPYNAAWTVANFQKLSANAAYNFFHIPGGPSSTKDQGLALAGSNTSTATCPSGDFCRSAVASLSTAEQNKLDAVLQNPTLCGSYQWSDSNMGAYIVSYGTPVPSSRVKACVDSPTPSAEANNATSWDDASAGHKAGVIMLLVGVATASIGSLFYATHSSGMATFEAIDDFVADNRGYHRGLNIGMDSVVWTGIALYNRQMVTVKQQARDDATGKLLYNADGSPTMVVTTMPRDQTPAFQQWRSRWGKVVLGGIVCAVVGLGVTLGTSLTDTPAYPNNPANNFYVQAMGDFLKGLKPYQ